MREKELVDRLANGKSDIIQVFLEILFKTGSQYCIVGGLAANAYVEPVVSLDVDVVVAAENIGVICNAARGQGLKVEQFEHSVNITGVDSDLRIRLQHDPRYQSFLATAEDRNVLGYPMRIVRVEDVLQGKV